MFFLLQMMQTFVVLAIIAIISFDIASCGVIRDEESYLLGNERISKRSADDIEISILEESSSNNGQNVEQHLINTRSIRSDEYRQHDDLLMNIVPKAIFGERIYRRFVEETVFRGGLDTTQNVVFKPQFILRESIVEKISLP